MLEFIAPTAIKNNLRTTVFSVLKPYNSEYLERTVILKDKY